MPRPNRWSKSLGEPSRVSGRVKAFTRPLTRLIVILIIFVLLLLLLTVILLRIVVVI